MGRVAGTIQASCVAAMLVAAAPAGAETFGVNERADHAPGECTNADCTVREAVIAADANPGDDRVRLPSRKAYRLTRDFNPGPPEPTHGDLDVDGGGGVDAITIFHPGPGRATVSAKGAEDRVIELRGPATLRKLVLRGGNATSASEAGGAIFTDHGVTIVKSRIKSGQASDVGGGIVAAGGVLELRNSKVTRNEASDSGGGVYATEDAAIEVVRSTISRNVAEAGGGVVNRSGLLSRISSSTISDNRATDNGGGVHNTGELLIVNSTITGNETRDFGGGVYGAPDSLAELNAVTVARNRADSNDQGGGGGGGLYGDGGLDVLVVRNTLVARNRSTDDALQECAAPAPVGILSEGGNLITTEDGGCDFFGDAEDILDSQPGIGQLDDNGGATRTIALDGDSPAINQADGPTPPDRDQRGVDRQNPDIGAFER